MPSHGNPLPLIHMLDFRLPDQGPIDKKLGRPIGSRMMSDDARHPLLIVRVRLQLQAGWNASVLDMPVNTGNVIAGQVKSSMLGLQLDTPSTADNVEEMATKVKQRDRLFDKQLKLLQGKPDGPLETSWISYVSIQTRTNPFPAIEPFASSPWRDAESRADWPFRILLRIDLGRR